MKPTQSCQAGFTLVELLVSLALISLMSIYALQSFQTMKTLDALGKRIDEQDELEAVRHKILLELGGARDVFVDAGTSAQQLDFEGKHDSISYVVLSNGEHEFGGFYRVTLSLSTDGHLVMKRQLIRQNHPPPAEEVELLAGVKALELGYYGSPGEISTPVREWTDTQNLPETIVLNVEFSSGDGRKWVPEVAKLVFAPGG